MKNKKIDIYQETEFDTSFALLRFQIYSQAQELAIQKELDIY